MHTLLPERIKSTCVIESIGPGVRPEFESDPSISRLCDLPRHHSPEPVSSSVERRHNNGFTLPVCQEDFFSKILKSEWKTDALPSEQPSYPVVRIKHQ